MGRATEPAICQGSAGGGGHRRQTRGGRGQNDKQLVTQTEVFDGESWTSAPDMPTPREHLAAASDGVYLYTIGGRALSADKNLGAFERFDPLSGKWDKLEDMPTPRGSYGAALVDGRIVAVGGEEPTRVLPTVEMYDISTGKWTTQAPINTRCTDRWWRRSRTRCTPSAARTGPPMKVRWRSSRRSTSASPA